ncbi:nitroreductase family protein [Dyadobacter sp. CY343]|uniref:nitroreductase family protein n=1 Tax=Dyadobacter sp. CY343 TaxID=2907299 RepID=UPI001F39E82D|nr:nitroreductase family protein [Dyadobacter sp. CY343]MCE7059709.1 nitroreductase family protein [Dyadobacter sp. CY343]
MIKELLKRPKKLVRQLIDDNFARLSVGSRKLSVLYYFLFDRSFDREIQAVLAGKIQHIDEAKKNKNNYFLLVRNTHRIEKGLLMKPRRDLFGKEYITETIDSFEAIWKLGKDDNDNAQIKWFYDVLNEYFSTINLSHPNISKEEARFRLIVKENPSTALEPHTTKSIPYHRAKQDANNVNYTQFYNLCKQRRSVRWFLDRPVPRELIDKAILAANQAPSACNRQPFEFRVFDDPEMVKNVVKLPMGTSGYGHSIPVMIVLVGNLDAYFDERDRHVMYIDASLASMSFMLALESMNLSSCSINWPDIEARESKMHSFLNLKPYQRPIMCMGIGYPDPDGLVAYSEKRPLHQIRKYN